MNALQRKREKLKAAMRGGKSGGKTAVKADVVPLTVPKVVKTTTTSSTLRDRMAARAEALHGSKFRWINEALYTANSAESFKLFKDSPSNFDIYHEGFRSQVLHKWPTNPNDVLIAQLKKTASSTVIGDFGCGDARLAASLTSHTVHSFDLVAVNDHVTACDIAHVPLAPTSLDVAVFCLSLMGINWWDFVREANRVLKHGAALKIVEVKSRIPNIDEFAQAIAQCGFTLTSVDDSNLMFLRFDFIKAANGSKRKAPLNANSILKPCLYKKR